MRRRALLLGTLLLALMVLSPGCVAQDSPPTEGPFDIAGFDGDAIRSDDHRSLSVSESFFYNNTGTEGFAGNLTLWVQPDAHISSSVCGSVANRIVRVEAESGLTCFDLIPQGDGFHTVRPFDPGHSLSYFGERHALTLNVTSQSTAAKRYLWFNATVGSSALVEGQLTVGNVTLRATDTELGEVGRLTWGPPRNLSLDQSILIENTGGEDETVDLEVFGLPPGWNATLRDAAAEVRTVSLPAGGNATIALNVTAPSHLIHLFLEYTIQGAELPSGSYAVTLRRLFPHNTTYALLFLYALEHDVVTATGSLQTHSNRTWDDSLKRYRIAVVGFDIAAGVESTVLVTWVPPPFVVPTWAIAALAVLGAALVAYPLWLRRGKERERKEEGPEEAPIAPMTAQELRDRRDTLRKTLDRLEADRVAGGLPEDLHADLVREAQTELADMERRLDLLTAAKERKRQILRALRRLERDRKDGKVEPKVYDSLKERYGQEAVKAMKQIDGATGLRAQEDRDAD